MTTKNGPTSPLRLDGCVLTTPSRLKLGIMLLMLLVSSFHLPCYAEYEPVTVYLTWQRSPESTITIHWITAQEHDKDVVEYRKENDPQWQRAVGSHVPMPTEAPYLIHRIELTNLSPESTYFFRIGQDGLPYKFQTMPAALHNPVRFIAGGDMYHDGLEILHETNRAAAKTGPLFALIGGDIAYASQNSWLFPHWLKSWAGLVAQKPDRWLAWLIAWKNDVVTPDGRLVPILPVLGNHDVCGGFGQTPGEAPFFYSLFSMPGQQGYNVLDFGNYMSIVLLDSGHTHPIGGPQTKWLAKTLAERASIPHKFAIYHVPAYPSARNIDNEYSTLIRKNWVPVFENYRLTAAFENHDHTYKRTFPIRNNQKTSPNEGVVYIGDGAWGVEKPRSIKNPSKRWYLAKHAPTRHFLLINVTGDTRQVTAISSQGQTIDDFFW